MRKYGARVIIACLLLGFAGASEAALVTIDGTVSWVAQPTNYVAGTISFALTNQPANPCQAGGYLQFLISTNSLDAENVKHMFATLLVAKATGALVRVGYDNAGGRCDQNSLAVERLVIL